MALWFGSIHPSLYVNHFAKEEKLDYLLSMCIVCFFA